MHEHESREDYLERILMIQEKHNTKEVHAIDIAKDLGMKVFPVYKVQSKPNAVPIYVVEVDTEIDTDTEEYKKAFIKYIPAAQRKAYGTKSWNVEDAEDIEESEELEDEDSDSQE